MGRPGGLGVALLVSAPVLLAAAPAHAAEDRELVVDAAAWSWRRVVPAGQPVEEPSNVPAGDLAVAYDGRPDAPAAKATYLRLALGDLPAGARPAGLQLVLPLDPSVDQDAGAAPLVACRLTGAFTPGEAVDPAAQPAEDCTGAPRGVYDASAGAVSFVFPTADDVTGLGVVVRPDPAAALPDVLPFQLVFRGPAEVVGRLTVQLAPDAPAPLGPEPLPVATVPPAAPVAVLPSMPLVPAAGAPQQPVPEVAPPPAAAPVTAPRVASAGVRLSTVRAAGRASAAGFATAAALGLVLLLLVAWSVGDAAHPRAYARAERRRRDRLRSAVQLPAPVRQGAQSRQGRKPLSSAASGVT